MEQIRYTNAAAAERCGAPEARTAKEIDRYCAPRLAQGSFRRKSWHAHFLYSFSPSPWHLALCIRTENAATATATAPFRRYSE
jgi:hypothetical protein